MNTNFRKTETGCDLPWTKKISISLLLFAISMTYAPLSYGAAVLSLNNFDVNNGNGNPVYYIKLGNLADTNCYVMVYGGLDPEHLYPLSSSNPGSPVVFPLLNGFFEAGVAVIPGLPDSGVGFFQIIAWEGDGALNGWQTAPVRARSSIFSQRTASWVPPYGTVGMGTLQFPANLVIAPVAEPAHLLSVKMTDTGAAIQLTGPVGSKAEIQYTTDLKQSDSWTTLTTLVLTNTKAVYVDSNASSTARFYRASILQ